MDVIRTCYTTKMRTTTLVEPVTVRWYFTEPGAPVFEGPSVFRSRIWKDLNDFPNTGMGEQSEICSERKVVDYVNGSKPPGATVGEHPCGSDLVAKNGAGPDDPVFPTSFDGVAPCCLGPMVWTSTILVFTGPTMSLFEGKGNSIAEGVFMNLFCATVDPPLAVGRTNLEPFNTFPFEREGAPECVVVFTGPPEAPTTVDLDFPTVSTTTLQVVWWGNGTARFLIRFNVSGNTHAIEIQWEY